MKTIILNDLFPADITYRQDIRRLAESIQEETTIDCSRVTVISRSAADEFYKRFVSPSRDNRVTLTNISDDLQHMLRIVERTQNVRRMRKQFPKENIHFFSSSAEYHETVIQSR